jgi:ribosome-associated protein
VVKNLSFYLLARSREKEFMADAKLKRKPARPRPKTSRQKALLVCEACLDFKAEDPVILNVAKLTSFTDHFVIASGRSTRQVQAIAEGVVAAIRAGGSRELSLEGEAEGRWVVVDWGDVVAHVFYQPLRQFYNLEKLWGDAKKLKPLKT